MMEEESDSNIYYKCVHPCQHSSHLAMEMEDPERGFPLALTLPNCCLALIFPLSFSPFSLLLKGSPPC